MKKILIVAVALTLGSAAVFAQGTVNFANVATGLNVPDFLSDGTTKIGTGFTAQLLTGSSSGSLSPITTTPYVGNGFFTGGSATVNVAAGSTAFFQVHAFLTADGSFAAAQTAGLLLGNQWGQSGIFTVIPADPTTSPPGTPTALLNLTSFSLNLQPTPEPATLALLGLGAACMFGIRRRKA